MVGLHSFLRYDKTTMEDRRSQEELSSDELTLDQSLQIENGDDQPSPSNMLETYLSAQESLVTLVDQGVKGEGESSEATINYSNLLLEEMAKGYARVVTGADSEQKYSFAAQLLVQSLARFNDIALRNELGMTLNTQPIEDVEDAIRGHIDELEEGEDELEKIEVMFGEIHNTAIMNLLEYAKENVNDTKRARRESLKRHAIEMLKDTTKIALGATAALLAVKFINKK